MKRLVLIIFLLGTFLLITDYKSAEYGNGFFTLNKSLLYGTELTTIDKTYIYYDGGWGYIMPENYFVTNDNDSIYIDKLLGYAVNNDSLYIKVKSDVDKILIFGSLQSVYKRAPIIQLSARPDVHWKKLGKDNMPVLFYYWRLIAVLGSMLIFILSCVLILKFIKKISPLASICNRRAGKTLKNDG